MGKMTAKVGSGKTVKFEWFINGQQTRNTIDERMREKELKLRQRFPFRLPGSVVAENSARPEIDVTHTSVHIDKEYAGWIGPTILIESIG
jgi:hypothetical protein